jgi:hypothetical protein
MDSGMSPAARGSVTKRKKRRSIGANFESQADLEAAKKEREVEELVELLPPAVSMQLLGGEAAVVHRFPIRWSGRGSLKRQSPSELDRMELRSRMRGAHGRTSGRSHKSEGSRTMGCPLQQP